MSQHHTSFVHLQALLEQVPVQTLRAGQVAGDKPGIVAGDVQICRLREGDGGAAYGALIVESVNALPALLKALQASAGAVTTDHVDENSPIRQQVESAITRTLHMLPGFKVAASSTWAKLIFAAVEPWLSGGREVLTAAPAEAIQRPAANKSDSLQQARLDAVADFCTFMLAKADTETRPNEYALEQLVNDWDRTHNSAQPAKHQQGGAE